MVFWSSWIIIDILLAFHLLATWADKVSEWLNCIHWTMTSCICAFCKAFQIHFQCCVSSNGFDHNDICFCSVKVVTQPMLSHGTVILRLYRRRTRGNTTPGYIYRHLDGPDGNLSHPVKMSKSCFSKYQPTVSNHRDDFLDSQRASILCPLVM